MATDPLFRPVDGASAAFFRAAVGLLLAASLIRFWWKGWIDELMLDPPFHFHYWGFEFVEPLPAPWLQALYALLIVANLCVAAGIAYRPAIVIVFVGFTYLELIDLTYYLNHYYFISIVTGMMIFMPLRRGCLHGVPAWVVWALRLQLGIVYFFAGLAKLHPDWLFYAQPLQLWLTARADLPWLGPLLARHETAFVMSWAGAVFDLTIPAWLLWHRTRALAYLAVLAFHGATGLLFNIGVFPWVMIACTPIFFDPSWPRRLLRRTVPSNPHVPPQSPQRRIILTAALALHFAIQIALPMRHHVYPGEVRWHEQGFRFAWNVMLIEKTGMVEFRVETADGARRWRLSPHKELTAQQTKMMSTQPDMILRYAHHLAETFAAQGIPDVSVRADAWASLNGRRSQRLVDPTVDLAEVRDGWSNKTWIVPLHPGPPLRPPSRDRPYGQSQ